MTLISPIEDVKQNTLKAITGALRKLEYVAGLRDEKGGYSHWGLVRVYGEGNAAKALTQVHGEVVSQILSTPLRNLLHDAEQSGESTGTSADVYLGQLSSGGSKLLPVTPSAGSARHLNSVLHALSTLLKHRIPDANHPV
jgi:hypothetical protein